MSNIIAKINQREFDAFFEGLIAQTDRVIEMNKRVSCGDGARMVVHEPVLNLPISQGRPPAGIQIAYDEGGSEVGHVSDWRDEQGVTDASAESERYK